MRGGALATAPSSPERGRSQEHACLDSTDQVGDRPLNRDRSPTRPRPSKISERCPSPARGRRTSSPPPPPSFPRKRGERRRRRRDLVRGTKSRSERRSGSEGPRGCERGSWLPALRFAAAGMTMRGREIGGRSYVEFVGRRKTFATESNALAPQVVGQRPPDPTGPEARV